MFKFLGIILILVSIFGFGYPAFINPTNSFALGSFILAILLSGIGLTVFFKQPKKSDESLVLNDTDWIQFKKKLEVLKNRIPHIRYEINHDHILVYGDGKSGFDLYIFMNEEAFEISGDAGWNLLIYCEESFPKDKVVLRTLEYALELLSGVMSIEAKYFLGGSSCSFTFLKRDDFNNLIRKEKLIVNTFFRKVQQKELLLSNTVLSEQELQLAISLVKQLVEKNEKSG